MTLAPGDFSLSETLCSRQVVVHTRLADPEITVCVFNFALLGDICFPFLVLDLAAFSLRS
jgi:hypothetical protein